MKAKISVARKPFKSPLMIKNVSKNNSCEKAKYRSLEEKLRRLEKVKKLKDNGELEKLSKLIEKYKDACNLALGMIFEKNANANQNQSYEEFCESLNLPENLL
ncbi:MAG: hypothetical protein MHMPM18_001420 [Marteilia pararefringens]